PGPGGRPGRRDPDDLQAERRTGADLAGALPLLSHALLVTWQQRDGRRLTLAGYQSTGGITDAVARSAEQVYAGLDAQAKQLPRRLLLDLVRIGDGADDRRRRLPLADPP